MSDESRQPEREGFGDEQGTRVGRPSPGRSGEAGHLLASEKASREQQPARIDDSERDGSTGAGAEAAEGVHNYGGRAQTERTGAETHPTGRGDAGGVDRAGSEPLGGRSQEHKSGYGGEGGTPRTSADEREVLEYDGSGGERPGAADHARELKEDAGEGRP